VTVADSQAKVDSATNAITEAQGNLVEKSITVELVVGAPHRSSGGSVRRTFTPAPASQGLVLGASTVNWNALTPAEKAEIIAALQKQLAEIIKMFEAYKSGLAH
jgi:hypothetical protein